MNSLVSQSMNVTRTHSTCVWLESNAVRTEWTAYVRIRGIQGLWYLKAKYHGNRPTSEQLYFDAYSRGVFSARPFRPGRPCDSSTDCCVLALIRDLCRERILDAAELIQRGNPSCPHYSRQDFVEAKHQAVWEGTLFPVIWGAEVTAALCLTLADPRWGSLAQLVGAMKT